MNTTTETSTVTFEFGGTFYTPIDRGYGEALFVKMILELNGPEAEVLKEMESKIGEQPFVNKVFDEAELKICYNYGFRPYGQEFSWELTQRLLQEQGSIFMTCNIHVKQSYIIELTDENIGIASLLSTLNKYHAIQMNV
ncbi:hypothetical protein bcgnr5390_61450 [Bacillus luti]|nr:hypothetical protein BC2903_61150 [Bacillus cereus]